jgi:ferredoxin--NADP+ reductase
MSKFLRGSVITVKHWTQRLCTLRIAVDFPEFEAGQFVCVGLEVNNKPDLRPYSLISSPSCDFIEIYFNTVPKGSLSTLLYQCKIGDSLLVSSQAAGVFTLAEVPAAKHLWLIATGTGIGPYLSMLTTPTPWQKFEKIVLVHSFSTVDELVYLPLIKKLQDQYQGQLINICCVTREKSVNSLQHRIQQCLGDGQLETFADLPISAANSQVMLCGNKNMIEDMIALLSLRGMKKNLRRKPGQITTEHYY